MLHSLLIFLSAISFALTPGTSVPEVSAKNQNGKLVKMADQKGKYVLLYFYPKDNTPGCTKEAQELRDVHPSFKKLNAVVFGVSKQDESSHKKFIQEHSLPFDLLVDSDGSFAKSMGVEMTMMGLFHKRQSLLIGPDGKVIKFYADVQPASHALDVLKDIQEHKGY